jgi:peptidyl-prolyl cis-trans isomerase A (cyclophilin A)
MGRRHLDEILLVVLQEAYSVIVMLPLLALALLQSPVTVVIETAMGTIEVELDPHRAPATTANFLKYVDGGSYDGGAFHRTVRPGNQPGNPVQIEVIQAGINPRWDGAVFPPVALERTSKTGLKHRDGAISMARSRPDSARSDFFLCLGDQPELDFGGKRNPDGQGFAAFGRVTRGLAVARAIQQAPADGQNLTPPVRIIRIRRR